MSDKDLLELPSLVSAFTKAVYEDRDDEAAELYRQIAVGGLESYMESIEASEVGDDEPFSLAQGISELDAISMVVTMRFLMTQVVIADAMGRPLPSGAKEDINGAIRIMQGALSAYEHLNGALPELRVARGTMPSMEDTKGVFNA